MRSAPSASKTELLSPLHGTMEIADMKKVASPVTAIVLGLIALAQLLRVIFQLEVTVQGIDVPRWVSALAFVVFGFLASWLWIERRR